VSAFDRFRTVIRLTSAEKDRIRQEIIDHCDLIADCWVYRTTNSAGYGVKRIAGKIQTTSRFMLAYSERESMNTDADACHVRECPYRACCNPRHLFWGTHGKNAEQREQEKRERRKFDAQVCPVPLGHETHGVDSSLQHAFSQGTQPAYT
jgi:hypothetical protein